MTHDPYIDRAANAIPNHDPGITAMTVEDIMRERGIGKRYAYAILRQMSEEQNTDDAVPSNQRERVLAVLYRTGIRNTNDLRTALHADGYEIDGHDTTKVLWSLQKTGHVKFRERQSPRMLFAIKLTDLGKADGRKYATRKHPVIEEAPETQSVEPPVVVDEASAKVFENARKLQQEINDLGAGPKPGNSGPGSDEDWGPKVETGPGLPWIAGNTKDWPALLDLRDRANRAKKLNAAAKILEEAGEDDMVLALMAKTDFTPLEAEVIRLLEYLKEIE